MQAMVPFLVIGRFELGGDHWDNLLPTRVQLATYNSMDLYQWWTASAARLGSAPRTDEQRSELAMLLASEARPVLDGRAPAVRVLRDAARIGGLAYGVGMRGDEARVVEAFAGWLSSQGWTVRTEVDVVDIVAEKDGRRLCVEVKGVTTVPGLDVDTAIGQLVRRMPSEADRSVSFALVVRDEPGSVEAAVRAPQRILDLLGMALYAVDEDGGVRQLFGRV
ncbi:hypothetical protein W59_01234 [Rhodococcus opacus RKJ300 = JCM 13270]|uniref:Uncharacterized protein n=1 Tax=Rhodococcus opacus RKJ300 = JCM 13270 TaxID=1165867 RepID=I0WZD5_RHOOP|nr:hypothetical protein W59_01234 [Rhodococcus opacus RKJ300 = JCM 13270]